MFNTVRNIAQAFRKLHPIKRRQSSCDVRRHGHQLYQTRDDVAVLLHDADDQSRDFVGSCHHVTPTIFCTEPAFNFPQLQRVRMRSAIKFACHSDTTGALMTFGVPGVLIASAVVSSM
jgi:hypothetical protein